MIKIFVTGGTFDKEYNELNGQLFFKETHIHDVLRLGRNLNEVSVSTLMLIDSLEMNEGHRLAITKECESCSIERIIITHGTDTMTETAKTLAAAKINKTIVLTGAMIPYTFGSSDGLFNLASSLAFVQTLPAGVFVVMNGKCFDWNNVRKNRASGIFEELK